MKNERMRITAYPRTAIVCDAYLPLDGIIYAELMRRTFGAEDVTIPGDMAQYGGGHGTLPLARRASGGVWYFACSFAQWEHWVDDRSFWVKRFDQGPADLVDFGRRSASVLTASGRYMGYNMPIFCRHALAVRWYAVGDIARLADMLAEITHVGKKIAQGWGRINAWRVEPWAEDWSVWRDGRLMRARPAAEGILYGVRPPYWNPKNQMNCEMPPREEAAAK